MCGNTPTGVANARAYFTPPRPQKRILEALSKLAVPVVLLLVFTVSFALIGAGIPVNRELGSYHYFSQRLPLFLGGQIIRVRYRGRVLDSDKLPKSGNSLGDVFSTFDGIRWIWMPLPGTSNSGWVDP